MRPPAPAWVQEVHRAIRDIPIRCLPRADARLWPYGATTARWFHLDRGDPMPDTPTAPQPTSVEVTATCTYEDGTTADQTTRGAPRLTAAWLRALADQLDPPQPFQQPTLQPGHTPGCRCRAGTADAGGSPRPRGESLTLVTGDGPEPHGNYGPGQPRPRLAAPEPRQDPGYAKSVRCGAIGGCPSTYTFPAPVARQAVLETTLAEAGWREDPNMGHGWICPIQHAMPFPDFAEDGRGVIPT